MKFLLDESADYPLKDFLTQLGYDTTAIVSEYPRSLKDKAVLTIANKEKRILITNDRDFGELVFRQKLPHSGIILLRLRNENLSLKKSRLKHVLTKYPD